MLSSINNEALEDDGGGNEESLLIRKISSDCSTSARFFSDHSYYTGEWDSTQSQPHGSGILTLHNGDRYEGTFQHGLFHGTGLFLRTGRCNLRATWYHRKSSVPAGAERPPPVLVAEGVSIYAGEWVRGRQHGRGTQEWTSGERFTGEFIGGWPIGSGLLVIRGGETKYGSWKEGKHIFEADDGSIRFDVNVLGQDKANIWSKRLWIAVIVVFIVTLILATQVLKL
jgi:hypothetical protein